MRGKAFICYQGIIIWGAEIQVETQIVSVYRMKARGLLWGKIKGAIIQDEQKGKISYGCL